MCDRFFSQFKGYSFQWLGNNLILMAGLINPVARNGRKEKNGMDWKRNNRRPVMARDPAVRKECAPLLFLAPSLLLLQSFALTSSAVDLFLTRLTCVGIKMAAYALWLR